MTTRSPSRRRPGRRRLGQLRPPPGISFAIPRCEVVAIADPQADLARAAADRFAIPAVATDHRALIARDDIDVIDVCTPSHTHFELAWAALEAGKHVLCEKPVAFDFRDTRRAAELARAKGLKTKLGFTFRYSPGVRYMRELVDEGFVGTPFIFNGYEQNSQWLDPQTPLRQVDPDADQSMLQVSSLEGYGAPIIDIGHWWSAPTSRSVVGTMRNFIPERMVRATGRMMRMNIDDGDIFMGEFANGAIGSIQTSFVTVGNYPGIEARIYGSEGRASSAGWSRSSASARRSRSATPDEVEFKRARDPASASIRRAAAARVVAHRCSTPTWSQLHHARSWRRRRATRATSTMARGCRRRSTPSSSRSASGAGSTCRSRDGRVGAALDRFLRRATTGSGR